MASEHISKDIAKTFSSWPSHYKMLGKGPRNANCYSRQFASISENVSENYCSFEDIHGITKVFISAHTDDMNKLCI